MASGNAHHDLSEIIGGCGRFQVTLTFCIKMAMVLSPWGMIFMAFGIYNPGWQCLDAYSLNTSFVSNATDYAYSSRNQSPPYSMSTKPPIQKENRHFTEWTVSCLERKECENIVYNVESSTIVTEWDLTCESAWVPSVIITISMVGVLSGSYASGHLGDKFGRKATVYGNVGLLAVFHLLTIFSVSWQMYASILFVIGFGSGGILSNGYHYPLEFVPGWWRGVVTALPTWNVGGIAFSIVVFLLRNWRHVHIAASVFSAIVFLGVFWTPDSVRWLVVSGKTDKAKRVVAKIAKMNGRPCPDTQVIDIIAAEEKNREKGHNYTYLDLFRIKSVRGFSIKFAMLWICNAISYYTISFGIKSLSGDYYINLLIFSIFELPGMFFVAPAVNKFGRRKAAMGYYSLDSLCAFTVVVLSFTTTGNVKDMGILVLALTCKMLTVGVWATITVFSIELYPTVVRSLHMGYLNGVSRIGAMIAPYLIPKEQSNIYIAFIIIGCLMFMNCCIIFTLPETKGRPLEDIAQSNKEEGDTYEVQPMQGMQEAV